MFNLTFELLRFVLIVSWIGIGMLVIMFSIALLHNLFHKKFKKGRWYTLFFISMIGLLFSPYFIIHIPISYLLK